MTHVMKLHPFDKCCTDAKWLIENKGVAIYQQFNCQHCGTKQTMDKENVMFESGTCEECGKVTNIKKNGCNFMVATTIRIPVPRR